MKMGTGIKLHKRYFVVRTASLELQSALAVIVDKHKLTFVETLKLLTEAQQDELKYMLRAERHPKNPEKKADEA